LLTRRGYSPEVIVGHNGNGNGHVNATPVPRPLRVCEKCGEPLRGRQTRFCSKACAADDSRARLNAMRPPQRSPTPGPSDLAVLHSAVTQLASVGASDISFRIGGLSFTVTP
jgi:hypothetical protein